METVDNLQDLQVKSNEAKDYWVKLKFPLQYASLSLLSEQAADIFTYSIEFMQFLLTNHNESLEQAN